MKLSISNIAWDAGQDEAVYGMMKQYGYTGLEIAPTRILQNNPYEQLKAAERWAKVLKTNYGFSISSMQSIWHGKQEKIFGSDEERDSLIEYTKKAIDFAEAINCGNLVFGCPGNRVVPEGMPEEDVSSIIVPFFRELGLYAHTHNTTIAMEANPPIYHTNYINDTLSAIELVKSVNTSGFRLNLDVGTMIYNQEPAADLKSCVKYINHVHISEPELKPIQKRKLHLELFTILKQEGYSGYVSIEMGKQDNAIVFQTTLKYLEEITRWDN